MFFKSHGTIQYNIGSNSYPMTDITKVSVSVNIKNTSLQSINVNNRTPEQIANDSYGDVSLYWTILFINNIIDPFTEWYMSDDQLYSYCTRKYSQDDLYSVRYFVDVNTDEVSGADLDLLYRQMMENSEQIPENIDAINNFEYEKLINEKRKVIKIIPRTLITRFVEDFKSTLKR